MSGNWWETAGSGDPSSLSGAASGGGRSRVSAAAPTRTGLWRDLREPRVSEGGVPSARGPGELALAGGSAPSALPGAPSAGARRTSDTVTRPRRSCSSYVLSGVPSRRGGAPESSAQVGRRNRLAGWAPGRGRRRWLGGPKWRTFPRRPCAAQWSAPTTSATKPPLSSTCTGQGSGLSMAEPRAAAEAAGVKLPCIASRAKRFRRPAPSSPAGPGCGASTRLQCPSSSHGRCAGPPGSSGAARPAGLGGRPAPLRPHLASTV
mmetsp:Transcript_12721/g.32158  ORF Transcript_12721/g.32158 Transcript_12721/m.32158 type:complete len:262 (-) Transcript_12721:288-1073(-)